MKTFARAKSIRLRSLKLFMSIFISTLDNIAWHIPISIMSLHRWLSQILERCKDVSPSRCSFYTIHRKSCVFQAQKWMLTSSLSNISPRRGLDIDHYKSKSKSQSIICREILHLVLTKMTYFAIWNQSFCNIFITQPGTARQCEFTMTNMTNNNKS